MSTEKEKYISEALLKEQPKKPPLKLKLSAPLMAKFDDLQNQINSIIEGGVAVSNEFGDNPHISISQKTLTEAFNMVWAEFERITGESLRGISMTVSPTYIIGNDCTVHISANTLNTAGKFEHIQFFWNSEEEPFLAFDDVWGIDDVQVELPIEKLINEKIIIRCEAQILGIVYTDQKELTRYNDLFLGAGETYEDLMINGHFNPEYAVPAAHHMRGAYDVEVSQGDRIILALGAELEPEFIRADINGLEITFDKTAVIIEGKTYIVRTSVDTYDAGTINVDING